MEVDLLAYAQTWVVPRFFGFFPSVLLGEEFSWANGGARKRIVSCGGFIFESLTNSSSMSRRYWTSRIDNTSF